jgi:hypothetical protein
MGSIPHKHPEPAPPAEPIDAGFRAWYKSCPCCLSEAHPDVKRTLDEEQAELQRQSESTG